jgi:hypothetical protein
LNYWRNRLLTNNSNVSASIDNEIIDQVSEYRSNHSLSQSKAIEILVNQGLKLEKARVEIKSDDDLKEKAMKYFGNLLCDYTMFSASDELTTKDLRMLSIMIDYQESVRGITVDKYGIHDPNGNRINTDNESIFGQGFTTDFRKEIALIARTIAKEEINKIKTN